MTIGTRGRESSSPTPSCSAFRTAWSSASAACRPVMPAGESIQASWAAGLWVYAFNAKKASLDGGSWLNPAEAAERLRLAGA